MGRMYEQATNREKDLVRNSQGDTPKALEHSREITRNHENPGLPLQVTRERRGEEHVKGLPGYYGSFIHQEDRQKGWDVIGHIYTQSHGIRGVLSRDQKVFNQEHVAGFAIDPYTHQIYPYNPPK